MPWLQYDVDAAIQEENAPGLVDALLQHLALLVLAVEHELLGVLGRVELADLAEDPQLAEHALHAERARLVGHDRHDVAADALVAQQRRQSIRTNDIVVETSRSPVPVELGLEGGQLGDGQSLRLEPPRRQATRRARPAARAGTRSPPSRPAGGRGDVADLLVGEGQARSGRGTPSAPARSSSSAGA